MNSSNRFRDRWITGLNRGNCRRATAAVVLAACGMLAGWGHLRLEAAIITTVTFPSSPTLLTATPAQVTGSERGMDSSRGWFGQTVTATSTFRLEQVVLAVNSAAPNANFEFGI